MIIPLTLYLKDFLSFKEETVAFKQNDVTCIMGKNLTEDSAESNGSGKSAFQSALELVYTGTLSRDVPKKKWVRRGDIQEGLIVHEAWNSVKNEFLRIEKFLHKTKSNSTAIYVFKDRDQFDKDKSKFKISVVNEDSDKWIEKYVGINKKDISNYFIPNELTYTSFFKLNDAKTKELISRFSNADIIDSVFLEVKRKSDEKNFEIIDKEREQLKLEGVIEKLREDLVKEQEIDFENEKNKEILKRSSKIGDCNNKITENKQKLDTITHSLSHFNNHIIDKRKTSLSVFKQYLQQYRDSSENFEEEYSKLNQEVNKIQETIDKSDKAKSDVRKDISSVEVDINKMNLVLKGKIACPKCSHEFNPSSNITVEDATKNLDTFKKELEECKDDLTKIEELQKKYEEKKLTVKGQSKQIDERQRQFEIKDKKIWKIVKLISSSIDSMTSKVDSYSNQLYKIRKDNEFQKEMIKKYEEQIETIKKSEKDDKRELELKSDIEKIENQIEIFKAEIFALKYSKETIDAWNINFKLFKSFLANKKLKIIQDMINKYLQDMKCDYRLKLEGFKTLANGDIREKITPYIFKDGELCEFGEFSKGERARIDFATLMTLQSLVNNGCDNGGLQLLFTDEIGEGLDSLGLKLILDSFRNTKKTILITTHVTNETIHNNILMIEKVNGISRVVK